MKKPEEMTRHELLNAHATYSLPVLDLANNDAVLVTVCISGISDDGIEIYQRDYDDRDGSLIAESAVCIFLDVSDGSIGKLRDFLNRWFPDSPSEPIEESD